MAATKTSADKGQVVAHLVREGAKPKCPRCGGRGWVETGLYYLGQDLTEQCIHCEGTGEDPLKAPKPRPSPPGTV